MVIRKSNSERLAQPKYREVIDHLRRSIRELPPGGRMPSFQELQERFGASTTTINRALALLEGEGLVVRRQGSGIFAAGATPRPRHSTIGIYGCSKGLRRLSFYSHLLAGVENAAHRNGSELLLLDSLPSKGWEKVDGLLLYGDTGGDMLSRLPVPIPAISLLWPYADCPHVSTDDFFASRRAAEYLISLGHRRIAYLGGIEAMMVTVRYFGYENAMMRAGLGIDRRLLREIKHVGLTYVNEARARMGDWLRDDWHDLGITALLAQNDHVAMGAIQALAAAGLRVPEDVSVIGFDGIDECEIFTPRLTSVEVPLEAIGERAAVMLLECIENGRTDTESVVLPANLVLRDSTAPPSRR